MKLSNWWSVVGIGVLGVTLHGCGSGGSDNGSGEIRVVNATLTHASIDLVKTDDANELISATAKGSASDYTTLDSDNSTGLQINDDGSGASLATTSSKVPDGQHYALVVYESNGTVKTAQIAEDRDDPSSGNDLRVINVATDGGAIDVYITASDVDVTTVSPSFTLSASTTAVASGYANFSAKAYRVRVYGQGSTTDLRLDVASIDLADKNVTTLILTPAVGGVLLNGGALAQQSTFTQNLNTAARVRLAASTANATADDPDRVVAKAGSIEVDGTTDGSGASGPSVGPYFTVPASSTLSVTVNGSAVAAPAGSLTAGADATLFVYEKPGSSGPAATLLKDDNHLSTTTSNYKMRLVNGVTGTATALTLRSGTVLIASNVQPGAASSYSTAAGNSNDSTTVQVQSPSKPSLLKDDYTLLSGSVYTFFVFGKPDSSDTVYPLLVQDNTVNSGQ